MRALCQNGILDASHFYAVLAEAAPAARWHNMPMDRTPSNRASKSRIRQRREGLDLTQAQLADLAGFDQSTIHKLETGKLRMKDYQYQALARALRCKVADIVEDAEGALVDPDLEEAEKILSGLTKDQRALWFQVGHSFKEPRRRTKNLD